MRDLPRGNRQLSLLIHCRLIAASTSISQSFARRNFGFKKIEIPSFDPLNDTGLPHRLHALQ